MGDPAYDYSDYDLPPDEDVAADQAAEQTSRLTVIQGGEEGAGTAASGAADTAATGAADTAATGVADTAVTGAADTAVTGATDTAVATGVGATLAAAAAGLLILFWPSDIAPDPPMPRASAPHPNPVPTPNPYPPVNTCPPDPCIDLLQDIRDAIGRDKRNFGNRGMHGVRSRWQELIDGPCGPGQFPYRVNARGEYVKTNVWQNHVDEFNRTKSALRNRFDRAIDAGCAIPDDLVDAAADAGGMEPPDPSQWRGDPTRPCTDSVPPADWNGPPEPPENRGL